MLVKCINDDFTNSESEIVKKILLVGDDDLLPKKGNIYEVIGFGTLKDSQGNYIDCYMIDIPSSENYGEQLVFQKSRFIIEDDTFIPNHFDSNFGLCRKQIFFCAADWLQNWNI